MPGQQLKKSEQISPAMTVVYDYDQPFTKRSEFLNAFKQALGTNCGYFMFGNHAIYYYDHDGKREYFLVGAITWLSGPHLLFKKRLQLKKWYKEFYDLHCNEANSKIHLTGVYHYDGLVVFIEFATKDYISKPS